MKRATAIAIYTTEYDKDGNQYNCLVNLSVVTRENHLVTLVLYDKNDIIHHKMYKYYAWHHMYDDILSIIRTNGYYLSSYNNFGRTWYYIQFICYNDPIEIKRYSHTAGINNR